MKKVLKLTAAALAAITAMSCAGVTAFADKLKTVDGTLYRYSDSGEQVGKYTGWVKTSKGRYYYRDGVKLKSRWISVKGKRTYFLRKDGRMATGDVKIGGKNYLFGADGRLLPDNFGVSVGINRFTRESVNVCYSHDNTGIAECEVYIYDDAYVERCTDSGWARVNDSEGADSLTPIYGEKNVNAKFKTDLGNPLPNGKYRLVLHGIAWSKQLVGGKMSFSFRPEFEVTDNTEHDFVKPPSLHLNIAGKIGYWQLVPGTSSWDNFYSDSDLMSSQESDSMGALTMNWGAAREAEYGDTIEVGGCSFDDPARIKVRCWPDKYKGDYSAYDKSEEVPVDGLTFKPKKGAYIYEIVAYWDKTPVNDIISVSGNAYYAVYINAE